MHGHDSETPSSNGFADKASAARHRFYGLEFTPEGERKEYYFLLVEPAKERAFLRALDKPDIIDLSAFGEIVARGYGEVPDMVREQMRQRYNASL